MSSNLIQIGSKTIRKNAEGLVSLTDLHAAAKDAGQAEGKSDPRDWQRKDGSQFIAFVASQLNVARGHIYAATRGKGGGTFAHWQIALAYAKYLSPELHMQVNEVYARAKSGDVTLAADIADRATPEKQEWLRRRLEGTAVRKQFTDTLKNHGVTGRGYADCTNAVYESALGGTKKQLVKQIGVSKDVNLRNNLTAEQLVLTAMTELVASKRIDQNQSHGNSACASQCRDAGRDVAALIGGNHV